MPDDVAFVTADVTVDETAGTVFIDLVRTGDLVGPVEVTYDITGASATAGEDFEGTGGTVTIPDGAASGAIEVTILDDALAEDANPDLAGAQPEVFGVSIVSVVGGEVGVPRTANVFILDDESPAPPPPPSATEPAYSAREEVVVPGVDAPIAIAWLPGDPAVMLIAEKQGVIRVYDTATDSFLPDLLDIRDEVNNAADRGLIDFVLHPDFPTTPKIYVTYTVDPPEVGANTGNAGPDGGGNRFNWLVTYDVDLSGGSPVVVPASKEILVGAAGQSLDDIAGGGALDYTDTEFEDVGAYPASDVDPATGEPREDYWKMDSRSHVGGGLAFGPDGALYVAVGDGTSFNYDDERTITVQDTDALAGKILRLDALTGEGLPDNPFYTGDATDNASKVWQLGLRNPFRITFDDDGQLFISNTGWFSWEEINSGGRGANFGWPLFEGGDGGELLRTPGYADQAQTQDLYAAYEAGDLVVTPPYRAFSHAEGVTEIDIDGVVGASAVYQGAVYPADVRGDFFFVDIAAPSAIYGVDTDDPDTARMLFELPDFRGPIVMTEGPDGYMYFGDIVQDFVGRWVINEQPNGDRSEAEAATLEGEVAAVAINPGFSGDGYADFGTTAADAVEWTVEIETAGDYELVFGYANGAPTGDRSLELLVDGTVIERLAFATTGTWLSWDEQTASAPVGLGAGTHTIRLQSDGGDGPNVDYVDVVPSAPTADVTGREAEDAILGGTVTALATNPGFSGTGYADFGTSDADFVEWTIEVDAAGTYDLVFGYANGGLGEDRSLELVVDEATVERLTFAPTGTWADWGEETTGAGIALAAGIHTVRLQSDGGVGPNVDYLDVVAATAPPAGVTGREAEDAILGGTVTALAANPGFSGTGYADFGTADTDFVEWTIEVDAAGTYDLVFGYANGGLGEDRSLELLVDDAAIGRLPFAPTGTWTDWGEQTTGDGIALAAGTHTVRLQSDGGFGPNVDYLDVVPADTTPPPVTADLEAEEATLGGTVTALATNAGFRGGGYADFGTSDADFVEWSVDVTDPGLYDLAFGYANGGAGEDRSLELLIDDTFVERLDFATTGTWTDWAEQAGSAPIDLDAGTHTIRLASDGGPGPNLDYLSLEFVDTPA